MIVCRRVFIILLAIYMNENVGKVFHFDISAILFFTRLTIAQSYSHPLCCLQTRPQVALEIGHYAKPFYCFKTYAC